MISLQNVSKRFGDLLVFENVNFEIEQGDSVVIIGASGCGKSTLLRCISRLTEPSGGDIIFDGVNIMDKSTDINKIRRRMGMVYQQFNLFSHLNVLENVILAPMKVLGKTQEEAVEEAEELLKTVGMYEHRFHMPNELSGGQKQRAAIARTLAMHPDIILFDEPTSALDPTMVGEVENVIKKLVASGMTSVIVTHEMRFAKNIASKVIFLADKTIYETGTADQIFNNPQKKLTREFLYRNRMLTQNVENGFTDEETVISNFKAFVLSYDHDAKQLELFRTVFDELIYPVFNSGKTSGKATLRLVCSETSQNHMLFISFDGLEEDPLTDGLTDELNRKILEGRFKNVVSGENKESSWEVCLVL